MTEPKYLVWLDVETTGLGPKEDSLLEVALAFSPFRDPFNIGKIYSWVLRYDRRQEWRPLDPVVVKMHTESGLFDACAASSLTVSQVRRGIASVFQHEAPVEQIGERVLAGSSVHFDKGFIDRYLALGFSHRHYDVSALKLFCESQGMPKIAKGEAHRAVDDIKETIEHARMCAYWLRSVWPCSSYPRGEQP